jgi:hypothetical protein
MNQSTRQFFSLNLLFASSGSLIEKKTRIYAENWMKRFRQLIVSLTD